MCPTETNKNVFREGDQALIIDRRGRQYLKLLRASDTFHSHLGNFAYADLIGREEGCWVDTSRGHWLLAVKPTMADFTRLMPRIATVVYPKDLGAIIVYGDIFPGASVLEAGTGSGALTIALTRAVGEKGRVVSYDVRRDMIERAEANVAVMLPDRSRLTIKLGDVYEGFEESGLDRIVLDLPEPWHVVPHASKALVSGGVFVSFLPTVLQIHDLVRSLRAEGAFDIIETMEVLVRPWEVGGRSVRPAQRMVSHTGFITTARRCSPRPRFEEPGSGSEGSAAESAESAEDSEG
jgi:tRNA (adenine57-N1/adenine58-N1)-methyltransferase